MPVLASSTSASSPSRRLGLGTGSYASSSSYSSSYGSSYTRSSSVFSSGARTASLDRSPYTAYKYSSPSYTTTSGGNSSSSATRDYLSSSRPPISTRNTSSSSSFYRYKFTPWPPSRTIPTRSLCEMVFFLSLIDRPWRRRRRLITSKCWDWLPASWG